MDGTEPTYRRPLERARRADDPMGMAKSFPVDEDIEPSDLDPAARRELRTLTKENSDRVARHLIAAGRALDEDPVLALQHARAARALAGRVGVVREAAGLAAYHAGEYVEALAELRTARRITGSAEHLAVMADCERGMGRPDRALKMFDDPAAKELDAAAGVELLLVMSGARRDLGQPDAGVAILDVPALHSPRLQPWTPRLWYGYAEALLAAGRTEEAAEWFASVDAIDEESETDAADRLAEILGERPDDASLADSTSTDSTSTD
jgi:tetratricopeptide (TPR) repeat protein